MTNWEKQQEKVRNLKSSIETMKNLIEFFEDHEAQLDKEQVRSLITKVRGELSVHRAWLVSAKSATGW